MDPNPYATQQTEQSSERHTLHALYMNYKATTRAGTTFISTARIHAASNGLKTLNEANHMIDGEYASFLASRGLHASDGSSCSHDSTLGTIPAPFQISTNKL